MKNIFTLLFCLWQFIAFAQTKELVICVSNTELSDKKDNFAEQLQSYLSKSLNMPVKIYEAENIFDLVEKLKTGEVHLAHINPFGYVLASLEGANVSSFMIRGDANGKVETYNSCLISSKASNITQLTQLQEKASELEMTFVNPTSTSGHLLPRLYLNSQDLQAEMVFQEIVFAGNHQAAIDRVIANPNTVGACAYSYLEQQITAKKVNKEDLNILWISENIPFGPVILQDKVSGDLREKLAKAYQNIQNDEVMWASIQKLWKSPNSKYTQSSKKDFDTLYKIANASEDLIFILNFYKE